MNRPVDRIWPLCWLLAATLSWQAATAADAGGEKAFSRLTPVRSVKIVAAAEAFPGGYDVENILKEPLPTGNRADYASHGLGVRTFIDFDLASPVSVAGFRHVQRNTPDTVAEANLVFSDAPDFSHVLATVKIIHQDKPGATSFAAFPPVAARYVRWQVTVVMPGRSPNVGGHYIEFFAAGDPEKLPRGMAIDAKAVQTIDRTARQPLRVTIEYPYAAPADAILRVEGQEPRPLSLTFGKQSLEYTMPVVTADRVLQIAVNFAGQTVVERNVPLKAARHTTIYILPHSHTDIGYTELQTEIEDKQVNNLLLGMKYARETAANPPGARFVWNVEVLWAADLFLRRLGPAEQAAFFDAVKSGQVALCGMYLNELTGLCRPEELVRLFQFATQLRERTGVALDAAMISDVPGYTWGTVPAMAQAGIRYFSVAPNYFDRIGDILVQWENKPFWWVGPDGKSKVLVWIPYKGYGMSHIYRTLTPEFVALFQGQLEKTDYPYDIAYMRWAGQGDNATPDPAICDFVKGWAAKYEWPKFIISSVSEAFRAFDRRYGSQLPQVRGDWTPYWEDGAGSSALETALNRASSDRLAQAEALWAMQRLAAYPVNAFRDAWNDLLLYSEHTWGAWCSISEPARRETREQWTIKQSYAVSADRQSRDLLSRALGRDQQQADGSAMDLFNTTSWPRTEVVTVPKYLSENRECVLDADRQAMSSQRLRSGELIFLAKDLAPLAARRYTLCEQPKGMSDTEAIPAPDAAKASGAILENAHLRVRLDEKTGGIVELRATGIDANLADTDTGHALNDYLYLVGDNLADLQRNGPVTIRVGERGPLVASLVIESDAPGCYKLTRELRLTANADFVEVINIVDKKRLDAPSYQAKEGKESVNFAFPFRVPGGEVRLDVPFGVVRPDTDQIPSACKNWFTVGRWADVANANYGVTWVTLDAPLVQVGGITATLLGSQTNPDVWRKKVGPTQRIYSWAMNNHWGTNYRAYQEGPTVFRFILRPHRGPTDPAEATRFATGFSQPLLVTGARGQKPLTAPLLRVTPADGVVVGLKPTADGRAVIVRLFNASQREQSFTLDWGARKPRSVRFTDTSERAGEPMPARITMPGCGLVALRAEFR